MSIAAGTFTHDIVACICVTPDEVDCELFFFFFLILTCIFVETIFARNLVFCKRKDEKTLCFFGKMSSQLMSALLCGLLLCITRYLPEMAAAQSLTAPVGIPFVTVYGKLSAPDNTWSELGIRTSTAQWLAFRYSALSSLTAADVVLYDQAYNATGDGYNMFSISLNEAKWNNGFIYTYLNNMIPSLVLNGVVGTNISVANATIVENPSPSVAITFDSFPTQYNGTWTGNLRMYLDYSPQVGKNISIGLNASGVSVDPWPLVVAFPAVTATFRLKSDVPGTYTFIRSIIGGTDSLPRYDFNVFTPTWTNSYRANLTITAPSSSIPNYQGQPSNAYTIMIPSSYLYVNPRVIVTLRASPAGMTLSSSSIAMTQRGVPYTFVCTGPVGTFTISYTVGPPTTTQNQNNDFFYSPTITHQVTFLPSLNVSTAGVPDAFMANPPASSIYGGAFSVPVPVHIQKPPKLGLTVTIDVENGEASPATLTFAPAGTTTLLYRLRALSTGIKIVRYTLGGLSKGDYETPNVRYWRVFGPNPACVYQHAQAACFDTNGCSWNVMKSICSNHSLPIHLSAQKQLFDGERSKNVTLTLPTPVRAQLIIKFIATDRLTFNPSTITLNAGESTANYTILPRLNYKERLERQPYYLQLTGADANTYLQQDSSALIRSKIECTCTYPWSFYVGTRSKEFIITCDTPPEVDVTFLPVAVGQDGIAFVLLPPLSGNNATLKMSPDSVDARFYAVSTASMKTGNFTVSFIVGGTNAARYAVVPAVPIRILPLGRLNPPPHFHLTEKTHSPTFNLDISIFPDELVYVNISVFNASSNQTVGPEVLLVNPTNVTYNQSLRNTLTVYGTRPGTYYFTFNISGPIANYFVPTERAYFEINPRHDGNAFTFRLQLGFMPATRCRVNVGRNSEFFKGQNLPDGLAQFCDTYIPVLANSTYDCASIATEPECRDALRETGNLCVWNISSCVLIEELQGNVTDVAYGSGFTLLLTKNKTVYSIGSQLYGQLGHYKTVAAMVPIKDNITAIAAGTAHGMALSEKGYLYAWGNNNQGQLGIGSNVQEQVVPTRITFPKGENITCITAGALHSGAVSLSGIAYVWGNNLYGQLANVGTYRTIARTPVAVGRDKFDGDSAIAIQCGEFHTMVATELASYTFGLNTQGQLGRPGYDEYAPGKPNLWTVSRYVAKPNYPSYYIGSNYCPK